jgi:uncharacterized DUF497 family protein
MFELDEANSEANFHRRGLARRVISARQASRRERDVYRQIFG